MNVEPLTVSVFMLSIAPPRAAGEPRIVPAVLLENVQSITLAEPYW